MTLDNLLDQTGTRRTFLAAALGAALACALSPTANADQSLRIAYKTHHEQNTLRVTAREGESPASIAKLYTGSEKNTDEIILLNNARRGFKEGQLVYVPRSLLKKELVDVLNENRFETVMIDAEDTKSNSLYDIAKNYTDYERLEKGEAGVGKMVDLLLMINQDISPRNPKVYDNQPILIPRGYLEKKIRDTLPEYEEEEEEKKSEAAAPKKKAPKLIREKKEQADENELLKTYSRYQNPLRVSNALKRIESWGDFGAGRRGRYKTKQFNPHPAVDIVCSVGTPLYPVAVGKVTYAGDEKDRRPNYWRNGKVVEITTANGLNVKYAHLSKVLVKTGNYVALDMRVGLSGISGNGGAGRKPHVHVQILQNGIALNPKQFFKQGANYYAAAQRNKETYLSEFRTIERRTR